MKEKLEEIKTKIAELRSQVDASTNEEDVKNLGEEISNLEAERETVLSELEVENEKELEEARTKISELEEEQRSKKIVNDGNFNPMFTSKKEERNMNEETLKEETKKLEERGALLKEGKKIAVDLETRATTVSSGDLLVPKMYKNDINESFLAVSGLVSEANYILLDGGDSYSVPFEKGYGEGDYTAEGADYANSDPDVDYAETGRAKITAYSEITKEATKLPAAKYQALVIKRVKDAILKKLGRQMIAGPGTSNTIKGIYNAPDNVIDGTSDVVISSIDADTLNTLVFKYGGDESVESEQKLILSKLDLQDFSKVKTADEKFVYKITRNGTNGTISYTEGGLEVPYTINSAIKPVSKATVDDKTLIYGDINSYELPVFSQLEIEESRDYKFKQGIIAYRGDVVVGGVPAKFNGFVRAIKGA